MKEKRDFSTCNMIIGAVLGAVVYLLFEFKFPYDVKTIICLIYKRLPYRKPDLIYDPLYGLATSLFKSFQFFFALFFIFVGVFLALSITKSCNKAGRGKVIKNILISLVAAPITYFLLDYFGVYIFNRANRFFWDAAFLLALTFRDAMRGLVLSLFVFNLKQYPKGKIKFALAGLISGWSCSLLILIVFIRLNLAENDLRILVKNSQLPLTIVCVGIVIMLMEIKANRQLEKSVVKF